jgi:uncharacterized protein YbaP (TraB family)
MRRLSLGGKGPYASGLPPLAEIRLRVRSLLPIACLAALAAACTSVPPLPVETGQLFLWEVERPDGQGGVAHVLGSVHMAEDPLAFDPAVDRALAEAEALVLEVDPEQLEPAEMARLTFEKGYFGDGSRLDELLDPEAWTALEQHAGALGLPLAMFRPMEPWLALLTLQVASLQGEGFDPGQGVEMTLSRAAEESGKPMLGLETAAEQFDAFDALPLEVQERMLRDFLLGGEGDTGARGAETVSLLIDAWHKGDAARIEAEVFAELGRDPSMEPYFERFYFARNRDMARDIAELVDGGGRWFVAVGAAHVVGARGIPSLLTERGYAVRRVPKTRP